VSCSRRLLVVSMLVVAALAFGAVALEASAHPLDGNHITAQMVTGVTQVTQMAFIVQPSSAAIAGQPFAVQPQVAIEDSGGTIVTSDASVVTLSKGAASTGGGNLSCSGGQSQAAVQGVASFVGCLFDAVGTYVIQAVDGALAPADSDSVVVSAVAPNSTPTPIPGGAGGGGGGGGGSGGGGAPGGAPAGGAPQAPAQPPPMPAAPTPVTVAGPQTVPLAPVVTLTLRGGQQILLTFSSAVLQALQGAGCDALVFDPDVVPPNQAAAGSLGGGNVVAFSPPIDIRLSCTVPGSLANQSIELRLPVLEHPTDPRNQFAWLVEVKDPDGQFFGYVRPASQFEPETNSLVFQLPASQLQGTLFLPATIIPAYLKNFDANVHIWSSFEATAVDFGVAGPAFTTFKVVAPQVGARIFVFNPESNNYGWIDAAGVGPVPAP
jgi:hypothetical protein